GWSGVNTDFGVRGIEDRFAQIEPKVLFTADSLLFNGKHMSLTDAVPGILEVLPTVERHVLIEQTGRTGVEQSTAAVAVPGGREVPSASFDALVAAPEEPVFERVEFSHPLWVLYSSGTTGKPKGIVHGHGGVVVEMNRANILQYDVRPGDIQYSAVATTWVVWNLLIDAMSRGTTIVTYDGAPFAGGPHRQFELLASERATNFGTGAAVLSTAQRLGYSPRADYDFSA